jgi:hypothetical protein
MKHVGKSPLLRLIAFLAVLVLGAGAVACGSSDDDSDKGGDEAANAQSGTGVDGDDDGTEPIDTSTPEGQVRAVLAQWTEGLQKPDPKAACAVITPKVEEQIKFIYTKAKNCEDVVRYIAPKVNPGEPDVRSVKVAGNKATLVVRSAKGDTEQTMEFTKQGGEWKISDGFGTPPKKLEPSS